MKNRMKIRISAAEKFAGHAIMHGFDHAIDAVDSFSDSLLDGFLKGNNAIVLDDAEESGLLALLSEWVEDMLVPEADQFIREWSTDAREEYYEREDARSGRY